MAPLRPSRPALLVLLVSLAAAAPAQVPEYEAKSEFLERFTRFIDWPADSSAETPGSPFVIGVVGRDPFGPYLDALAASRTIKGKSVRIKRLSGHGEVAGCCHLLFIAGSESAAVERIVGRTADRPVLTVGDTPGYAQAGVLINLYEDKGRIGFEVNESAVRRSGLRFNSKLLRLARMVGGEAR
jgi:hypothetical protein